MSEQLKYVTYFRVSTDKQGKSGLGLEAQMASVSQFVEIQNAVVLDSFTEIESGKREDRPELSKAIRKCSLTGAVLVIAKLDRLSRDIAFIANLQKSKVDFICCDMPDANCFTIGMMSVLAQYEREMISERTKAGLKAAKKKGIKLGNPSLHLVRNTDTARATAVRSQNAQARNRQLLEIIHEIEHDNNHNMTLNEIASALNETSYRTARGYKFTKTQVSRIKASQKIAG